MMGPGNRRRGANLLRHAPTILAVIAIVTICTTMISIFQLFPSSGEKATVDATRQDSYLSSPVVKPRSIITPVKPATEELRVEQVPVSSFVTPKPVKAVEEHKEEKEEKTGTKGDADADDEPIAEYPPGYFVPADGETTKTNKDDNKVTDDKKQVKWAHEDQAFVFLLTNDQPMHLIWALEGSLRNVNSTRRRIVLATPKVSDGVKDTLRKLQMEVRDIEQPHHKNFKTQFSHWADTLAKLFIFDLPGIKQFIYLDADTMVNKNVDYLFEKDTNKMVYAMRDVIDCVNGNPHMNAGLLVARPNATLKAELFNLLEDENFFKDRKGDQEMLDVYLQKHGMLTLLPETAMSFLVRCNCLRHKTITHYELDDLEMVHFTKWFIDARGLLTRGATETHNCGNRWYIRWIAVYRALEEWWKKEYPGENPNLPPL